MTLGYQSESGPWRDSYLTAAYELRHGISHGKNLATNAVNLLSQTPIPNFLDAMATRLDGLKAEGEHLTLNITFTDLHENYLLTIENSVLHHSKSAPLTSANVTIRLTRPLFLRLLLGQAGLAELTQDFQLEGSKLDLVRFLALFDKPEASFPIVTP